MMFRVLGMRCGLCHVSYRILCSCLLRFFLPFDANFATINHSASKKKCTWLVWECVFVCAGRIVNHCDDASARDPKMEISVGKFSDISIFPVVRRPHFRLTLRNFLFSVVPGRNPHTQKMEPEYPNQNDCQCQSIVISIGHLILVVAFVTSKSICLNVHDDNFQAASSRCLPLWLVVRMCTWRVLHARRVSVANEFCEHVGRCAYFSCMLFK